eukprot:764054-Hanusia_phi.AAC.2
MSDEILRGEEEEERRRRGGREEEGKRRRRRSGDMRRRILCDHLHVAVLELVGAPLRLRILARLLLVLIRGDDHVEEDGGQSPEAVGGRQDNDERVPSKLRRVARPSLDQRVGRPLRNDGDSDAEGEGGADDEAVAAVGDLRPEDLDAGDDDVDEEEGGHAAEHTVGDSGDDGGDLGDDAEDEEEGAAAVASSLVCAPRQGNHAIVLRERRVGRSGEQAGDEGAEAVSKEPSLHPAVEHLSIRLLLGSLRRRRDVSYGLNGRDDVADEQGHEGWSVDGEGEGVDPEEGDPWSTLDPVLRHEPLGHSIVVVVDDCRDEKPEQERDRHLTVAEEGRPEDFDQDQRQEHREAKSDVLWRAEGKDDLPVVGALGIRHLDIGLSWEDSWQIHEGLARGDFSFRDVLDLVELGRCIHADAYQRALLGGVACSIQARRRAGIHLRPVSRHVLPLNDSHPLVEVVRTERPPSPVLHPGSGQADADEQHAGSCHDGRKRSSQLRARHETQQDLQERADHGRAQERPVRFLPAVLAAIRQGVALTRVGHTRDGHTRNVCPCPRAVSV